MLENYNIKTSSAEFNVTLDESIRRYIKTEAEKSRLMTRIQELNPEKMFESVFNGEYSKYVEYFTLWYQLCMLEGDLTFAFENLKNAYLMQISAIGTKYCLP